MKSMHNRAYRNQEHTNIKQHENKILFAIFQLSLILMASLALNSLNSYRLQNLLISIGLFSFLAAARYIIAQPDQDLFTDPFQSIHSMDYNSEGSTTDRVFIFGIPLEPATQRQRIRGILATLQQKKRLLLHGIMALICLILLGIWEQSGRSFSLAKILIGSSLAASLLYPLLISQFILTIFISSLVLAYKFYILWSEAKLQSVSSVASIKEIWFWGLSSLVLIIFSFSILRRLQVTGTTDVGSPDASNMKTPTSQILVLPLKSTAESLILFLLLMFIFDQIVPLTLDAKEKASRKLNNSLTQSIQVKIDGQEQGQGQPMRLSENTTASPTNLVGSQLPRGTGKLHNLPKFKNAPDVLDGRNKNLGFHDSNNQKSSNNQEIDPDEYLQKHLEQQQQQQQLSQNQQRQIPDQNTIQNQNKNQGRILEQLQKPLEQIKIAKQQFEQFTPQILMLIKLLILLFVLYIVFQIFSLWSKPLQQTRHPRQKEKLHQQLNSQYRALVQSRLNHVLKQRLNPSDEVIELYNILLDVLGKCHLEREKSFPVDLFTQEVKDKLPQVSLALEHSTETFSLALYGRLNMEKPDLDHYRQHIQTLMNYLFGTSSG